MHIALAPGESVTPKARAAIERAFEDKAVAAALLPLEPLGRAPFPRAARRYLASWDRRFLHPQNFYAPATRVAARAPPPGPRNADAAPALADALARGGRIVALPHAPVATHIGDDLSTWSAHFRAEGEAWGALAARDARFAGFVPALRRRAWWRHNLAQLPRRVIEELQAVRSPAPLPLVLHLAREAAFTGGAVRAAGATR